VVLFREESERGGTEIGAAPAALFTSSGKRSIDQCTNPWCARIPAALAHTAASCVFGDGIIGSLNASGG
jgi:hypothetical protein